jgi:hypothetical protein
MRFALAALFLAAACGSKSPAPAEPAPAEETTAEEGPPEGGYVPSECDSYCAEGCAEVELTEECLVDCGCPKDWTGEEGNEE